MSKGNNTCMLLLLIAFATFCNVSLNAQKLEAEQITKQIFDIPKWGKHVIHVNLKSKAVEWSYAFTTNPKNRDIDLLYSVTARLGGFSVKMDIPKGKIGSEWRRSVE